MIVLDHIIDSKTIIGISPLQQVNNHNDGGRRARFYIYTTSYPVVIETKIFYAGLGTDEQDWPEAWRFYSAAHKKATKEITSLLNEKLFRCSVSEIEIGKCFKENEQDDRFFKRISCVGEDGTIACQSSRIEEKMTAFKSDQKVFPFFQ